MIPPTADVVVVVIKLTQMSISPAECQRRLQTVLKLPKLQEIVSELILKDEQSVKQLKEADYKEGDIYGNGAKDTYRSLSYASYKRTLNPLAGGNVDLIVTGQFVDAMYLLRPRGGKYLFGNRDKKRNILKEMYGEDIFGLNQQVFEKYQKEIVRPRFVRAIKQQARIS